MPSSIVTLSKSKHAALAYTAVQDYSFAAEVNVIPLLMQEAERAADCFAIIFPRKDSAMPFALTGLGEKNIFVDARGRWTAPYMPLTTANYPFSLANAQLKDQGDRHELLLAIDENAPHFLKKKGQQPLYDADGQPSPFLKATLDRLGRQYQMYRSSRQAVSELQLSGVLRERTVVVRVDGQDRPVAGLRVADREKVMALPDATLARWAKNGILEMLFAHWHSLRHLDVLLRDSSCPATKAQKTPKQ